MVSFALTTDPPITHDSHVSQGTATRDLILGYDCPADSLLLPAAVHSGVTSARQNAICIFERDSGKPLSRHTGYLEGEMGVSARHFMPS